MDKKINCSAIILAGGLSSRMNYNPKGLLTYDNETFMERELRALENFDEIIISCNDERIIERFKNYKIIRDKVEKIGPLGGIYSTLNEIKNDKAIIVSCDMPFLEQGILEMLGREEFKEECLVPTVNGSIEPFCGVYKKEIIKKLEKSIKEKQFGFIRFIKLLDVNYIDIKSKNNFTNVNTIEEYNKLLER